MSQTLNNEYGVDNFAGQKANMQMPATRHLAFANIDYQFLDDVTDIGVIGEVPRAILCTVAGDLYGLLVDQSPFPYLTADGVPTEEATGRDNKQYAEASYIGGLLAGVIYPFRVYAIDTANTTAEFTLLF